MDWLIQFESMDRKVSKTDSLHYGKGGRILKFVVDFAVYLKLELLFVFIISGVLLARILYRSWLTPLVSLDEASYIFVGCGSRAESHLYHDYRCEIGQKAIFVQENVLSSLFCFQSVKISDSYAALFREVCHAHSQILDVPNKLRAYRNDFIVALIKNVAYYVYVRLWFYEAHKVHSIKEVAFLSWGYASFAAKEIGLQTCFIQHGFLYVRPKLAYFDRVIALTGDEACAIRNLLQDAKITITEPLFCATSPSCLSKIILVVSDDYTKLKCNAVPDQMSCVIKYFFSKGYSVAVKPYVGEKFGYWFSAFRGAKLLICDANKNFEILLEELAPRFVVSIGSTCLATSLSSNIIPLRIDHPDNPDYLLSMMYPLASRSLNYPEDIYIIDRLLNDDDFYVSELRRLKSCP